MARPIHLLSTLEVKNSKPSKEGKIAMLNDGGGLYLRVSPGANGAVHRNWVFRFSIKGRENQLSLGAYGDGDGEVSLAKARDKAAEQRKLRRDGADLVATKRREKETPKVAEQIEKTTTVTTFQDCAEEYLSLNGDWSPSYRDQWKDLLNRFVYPVLGKELVANVDRAPIKLVLMGVGKKPTTVRKVLGQIAAVLSYAVEEKYRPEGPNPASPESFKLTLKALSRGKASKHHSALKYQDAPAFIAALKADPGTPARALEFAILTASRTKEVRFAVWGEIDLGKRLWTIPAARMKMRDSQDRGDHIVPLSDAAVEILRDRIPDQVDPKALVFTGRTLRANAGSPGRRLGSRTLLAVVKRIRPEITAHGFRSTFMDWSGNKTEVEEEIREFALAHVKTGTAAAYRRETAIEKRAGLMQQWADFCSGVTIDNVVPLKQVA
jgi:integrase